jgi:DNA-directed RNA polymerase subunit E'/Rpb7
VTSALFRLSILADPLRFRALQKELTQNLSLHPSYFTPHLKDYLFKLLNIQVEGSCSGRLGYVIAVIAVTDVGRGKVVEGGAEFKIKYRAIVYRPFRGEVVDGVVASVNKVSSAVFAHCGEGSQERSLGGCRAELAFN